MAKTHDIVAVTGTYTDREGNEKKRYQTIGAIIDTRNGPMIKLESVPLGWDGWAYMNEPKVKDKPHQKPGENVPAKDYESGGFDDDIPFMRIQDGYTV